MMQSFAFLLVATSLCVIFVPATDGLSCYSCAWNNSTCNAEKIGSNILKETCGETTGPAGSGAPADSGAAPPADGAPPADAAPADAAPPAEEAPAARRRNNRFITESTGLLHQSIRSKPFLSKMADDKTYHCYEVHVKSNNTVTVGRGCKTTDKTDDCLKLDALVGTVEKCTTCTKDNCNSGFSLSSDALLIHFSLLLAIGIANIFFQTK